MRLKHHKDDSQVIDSNRHCQFGTRGSEVRILSPRPLKTKELDKDTTYCNPPFVHVLYTNGPARY